MDSAAYSVCGLGCVPVCHRCCVGEVKFFVNSLNRQNSLGYHLLVPMLHHYRCLGTKPNFDGVSLNGGVKHTNTVRPKDNYAKIFRRTFYFCHVTKAASH